MENIQNNQNTEVVENTTETTDITKTDEELFALLDKVLAKRETGLAKSALKDNGMADDEISEVISRYKASKQTAKDKTAEEITALKNRNAELEKQLFDIDLNKAAKKAAKEIGMNVEKLSYAMKLADTKNIVKDGKIDETELKSALENLLKDIPEFKTKKEAEGPVVRKVGVENKEPETEDALSKMRKAFGLSNQK